MVSSNDNTSLEMDKDDLKNSENIPFSESRLSQYLDENPISVENLFDDGFLKNSSESLCNGSPLLKPSSMIENQNKSSYDNVIVKQLQSILVMCKNISEKTDDLYRKHFELEEYKTHLNNIFEEKIKPLIQHEITNSGKEIRSQLEDIKEREIASNHKILDRISTIEGNLQCWNSSFMNDLIKVLEDISKNAHEHCAKKEDIFNGFSAFSEHCFRLRSSIEACSIFQNILPNKNNSNINQNNGTTQGNSTILKNNNIAPKQKRKRVKTNPTAQSKEKLPTKEIDSPTKNIVHDNDAAFEKDKLIDYQENNNTSQSILEKILESPKFEKIIEKEDTSQNIVEKILESPEFDKTVDKQIDNLYQEKINEPQNLVEKTSAVIVKDTEIESSQGKQKPKSTFKPPKIIQKSP